MATQYWTGTTSTDCRVTSNWRSGSLPVSGDNIIFSDTYAVKNCVGDLTGDGAAYFNTIRVDPGFYKNYTLGSSSTRLTLAALSTHIDAREVLAINTASKGGSTPFYLFFKEPSGSDTNKSLIINERVQTTQSLSSSPQRRHYDIKGYVEDVSISDFVGTGFVAGETGVSLKWANTDADGASTGFVTFKITGFGASSAATPHYKESIQLGPWGSAPTTITSMSFKWIHCVKLYLDSLGSVTIDADFSGGNYTNIHVFNTEWTPQVPTTFDCVEGVYAPIAGLGVPQGGERATGSIVIDSVPADGDTLTVGTTVFYFDDNTSLSTTYTNSSNQILVSTAGSPTVAEVATELINAINRLTVTSQKATAGTSNQYWVYEAYNDSNPSNSSKVHIRSTQGGSANNATITNTGSALTVVSLASGSSTASTENPYSIPVTMTKLVIDAQDSAGVPAAVTNMGSGCQSPAYTNRSSWNLGFIDIYVPCEIDRLEMSASTSGASTTVGAYLAFHQLSQSEHHIIHDGFYDGGYIDMSALDPGTMIIDHGTGTTPSGGLQWRAAMDVFDDDGKSQCWDLAWPINGCELFIDAEDISESNPFD